MLSIVAVATKDVVVFYINMDVGCCCAYMCIHILQHTKFEGGRRQP